MTVFSPAYRARVLKPRSQQPDPFNETELLIPRAGGLHSDSFQVATLPGVTGYKPYLALPRGRRGRVDLKSKKTDIGSLSLRILDQYVNQTSSTNAQRWATAFWGDESARTALATCRVEVDESLNGGLSWRPFYVGRIENVKLIGATEIGLSLTDLMGDMDDEVFADHPIDVAYANILPLMPIGLTHQFGNFQAVAGPAQGEIASTPYRINTGELTLFLASDAASLSQFFIPRSLMEQGTERKLGFGGFDLGRVITYAGDRIKVRLEDLGGASWWWLRTLFGRNIEELGPNDDVGFTRLDYIEVAPAPELNPTAVTFPGVGVDVTWAIYQEGGVGENAPLAIGTVDPVILIRDIIDGKFGQPNPLTGEPLYPVARAGTAWTDLVGVFPPVSFMVTEKAKRRQWLTDKLCQMLQLAIVLNAAGQCELLDLRRGNPFESLAEITDAELVAGRDSETVSQDASQAITLIIAPTVSYTQLDQEEEWLDQDKRYPEVPPGLIRVEELDHPPFFTPWDVQGGPIAFDPRSIDFGLKPFTIDMTGLSDQITFREFLDFLFRQQASYRQRLARDLFAMFSHGPEFFTTKHRRGGIAEETNIGDRRFVTVSKLPHAGSNLRGGTRAGLCLERTEDGGVLTLSWIDLKFGAVAVAPTLTNLVQDPADCHHTIRLNIALNATDDPVVVEIAVTAIGGARPAEGSGAWYRVARVTEDSPNFAITGLPSGSRIHVRYRSEP